MSDPVQLALIASIPPTLAALAALVIGIRNSRKADTIITKSAEIHESTNGNLSKVSAALELANGKIEELQKALVAIGPKN